VLYTNAFKSFRASFKQSLTVKHDSSKNFFKLFLMLLPQKHKTQSRLRFGQFQI